MADILDQILADPAVAAIGTAVAAAIAALWLAAAWWAYADAARRSDLALAPALAAGWILLSTPLLLPLSLPIYALVRPQEGAAERRTRRLAVELVDELDDRAETGTCVSCHAPVEAGWRRCPTCTTWLALPCSTCGRWSDRTLEICPFCGAEDRAEPASQVAGLTALGRPRRGRRPLRGVGPGRQPVPVGPRRFLAPDGRPLASLRAR